MKPFRSTIAVAAALALTLALPACDDDETGRISVRLTDAAGDLLAAKVTIDRITLHGGPDGDVVLSDDTTVVDLLSLANATEELVKDAEVPVGTYTELRFHVTGGYIEVESESGAGTEIFASSPDYAGLPPGAQVTGRLQMPSFDSASGLKVKIDPSDEIVVSSGSKILLVDFDVAQSFGHPAGNSGAWVMHPVIKGADLGLSGNVVATLALAPDVTLPVVGGRQLALGDFQAVLGVVVDGEVVGEERLPFAATEAGPFTATFRFLLPGRYRLSVSGPAGLVFVTAPPSPVQDVTVPEGGDARVAFTITSATVP